MRTDVPLTDYPLLVALVFLAGSLVLGCLYADVLATRSAQAAVALAALSHAVTAASFLADQVLNGRQPDPPCTGDETPPVAALTPLADELYASTTSTFLEAGIAILLVLAITPRVAGASGTWRQPPWRMAMWALIAVACAWTALQPRDDAQAALASAPDRPLPQATTLTVLTLVGMVALLPNARLRHTGRVALGIVVGTAFSQFAFAYQLSRSHVTASEGGPDADLTYGTDLTDVQFEVLQHVINFYSGSMFAAVCIWVSSTAEN